MKLIIFVLIVSLTGCAFRPVIDSSGTNMANYSKDLAECQAIAQANDSTAGSAATGAAIGAGLMAALSAILGGSRSTATWAGAGAVSGGAQGAGSGIEEQRRIVRNCLLGRGYKVLN